MTDNSLAKDWHHSTFYQSLHLSGRDLKEVELFIEKLMMYLQPSGGDRILEVASGDGFFSQQFAERGFEVTGVDASSDAVAQAQQLAHDTLSFYEHDVRLPFWANYFNFIFNFLDRFGFYRTRREHDAAIRSIASALKPGGTFVIDYFNANTVNPGNNEETKLIGDFTYSIQRRDDETHFYQTITVTGPTLSMPILFTAQQAKLSLGDFTEMCSEHGLQVQDVFGNYNMDKYEVKNSPRLIVVAKKKNYEPTDKDKRIYSDGRKTDALT